MLWFHAKTPRIKGAIFWRFFYSYRISLPVIDFRKDNNHDQFLKEKSGLKVIAPLCLGVFA